MRVNRLAIATCSLGLHPSHTLPLKIQSAASAGFAGIELFYSDLQQYAQDSAKSLLDAALQVKELCSKEGITIVTFGPMTNFEGCLSPLSSRLKVASEWIAIARVLETTVIRIPSATDENASGDEDLIITELRALCALGAEGGNPISFAYESLSYGTHAALWEDSLRLAQLVDRPNFGLCLDTFHVCARVWANPQTSSGKIPGGTAALGASLKRFVKECPMDKVFIVQLSDAERMDPPILPGHAAYEEGKDAVACWSGYGRLFPLEEEKGIYLPVVDVAKTWLVDKAWGGWISLEVFHREMKEQSMGPGVLARRGMQSWERLRKSIGLEM
ncbi:xylose isomerase-like protein [Gloeophyllum trabeum ATCC 11539]|uniref:Xylose isomerase-like protein n=1 Tax=Gloeophyllum trabeum (strain ATCC 11539 / FP-39264 / Madison 617) TaxID=670483 RepID=S7QJE5_GLOTA|nr:xylose isomerase-like protein [Gloeophyllum trabeum ATCC 11539]EPQ59453.1 xylose isomerase-like protein [Gloeophyllum trabeum ATCC 11539]